MNRQYKNHQIAPNRAKFHHRPLAVSPSEQPPCKNIRTSAANRTKTLHLIQPQNAKGLPKPQFAIGLPPSGFAGVHKFRIVTQYRSPSNP